MKKSHNRLTALLSLSCLSLVFSCDLRSREEFVGTDQDNTCVITWQNADGTILDQEVYEIGKLPEYKGDDPINNDKSTNSYLFQGWEPEIKEVSENTTYTAVYETVEAPYTFRLNTDGESCRLVKWISTNKKELNIDVPNEYNGKPVTVIDNYAFRGLSWIKSISIPDTVTEICDYAFQNTGITSITIPESVTTFGTNVFKDCKKLSSITLPSSIDSIPERFFYNCDSLVNFTIPESVVNIGAKAFYNCDYLKTVELSNSVVNIDNKAFYQCEKLSTINVNSSESNLRQVGEYALSETGIDVITLPDKLENIASYAFANCLRLTSFYISNNNTNDVNIKKSAFEGCRKLQSFNAPSSVSTFESAAFKDCTSLTSFSFGNSTREIDDYVFQNCSSLSNVTFTNPSALLKIGKKAFYNTKISSITIPENVNAIGEEAFYGCSLLKSVIFPGGNFAFGNRAFGNCPKLTSLFLTQIEDISRVSVDGSYLTSSSRSAITNISLPNNVYSILAGAFDGYTNLQYNPYTEVGETGYVGYYLGNSSNPYVALIKAEVTGSNTTFKIHPSCKIVANSAFASCSTPFSIEIDTALRNLGESTFSGSAIKSITFTENASLPLFKTNLFKNCTSLTDVSFPKDVNDIDSTTFTGCDNLTSFSMPTNGNSLYRIIDNGLLVKDKTIVCGVKNYDFSLSPNSTVFNGITTIGVNAFYKRYNLSELKLPGCIEIICSNAYYISDNSNTPNSFEFGFDTISKIKQIHKNAFGSLNNSTNRTIKYKNGLNNWLDIDSSSNTNGIGTSLPVSVGGTTTFYYFDSLRGYTEISQNLSLTSRTSIPDYAFCGNKKIQNVYFSNELKTIGQLAFYNCTNLENITFEREDNQVLLLEKIGYSAFEGCTSFKGFKLYNSGTQSNASLVGLTRLSIIGNRAFYNCQEMSSRLYFYSLSYLGANAFYNTTKMSDQSLIFNINKQTNFGDNKDISFIGANKLNSIILFFKNPSFGVTIDQGTFDKNVKLYCCWTYQKSNYQTDIGDSPNKTLNDYSINNLDSRASIYYHHSSFKLVQDQKYNSNQNWFTIQGDLQCVEGKPEPPEPDPSDETGSNGN